jgi:hypothetical protein
MLNTLQLTTTRRLPVAFVVPDWSALDDELTELIVHSALLHDAGPTALTRSLDCVAFELARVQHTLSVAVTRWEQRVQGGMTAGGRSRAIALLQAYEAAIQAATKLADFEAAALDREVTVAQVEVVRAAVERTLVEIDHLA